MTEKQFGSNRKAGTVIEGNHGSNRTKGTVIEGNFGSNRTKSTTTTKKAKPKATVKKKKAGRPKKVGD
jgi:hypothetical protein|tara:strand:- start:162 stop:365 length:204 start_codon:yes stop_codon:yes gene_type:complete